MALLRKKQKLGLTLAGTLLTVGFFAGCPAETVPPDPLEGYRMAVVDLQPLVELHPDASKLEQISDELAALQEEKIEVENEARQVLISSGGDKMAAAVEKAKAKLEAERATVEQEIAALGNTLSAQIQSEMSGLQASFEAELKNKISSLAPPPVQPQAPPKLDANIEAQIQDYMTNLALVRERNLAARRLELEKRVGDEINAKLQEVNGQVSAYESELAAQYQTERLNLQLTAQNSTDEEAKAAADARLNEISREIESAKAARRAELEGGYAAVRAEKTAQVAAELEAYQNTLNQQVAQKVEDKRREIGGVFAPPPAVATRPDASAEVKAQIAAMEGRMRSELAGKKAALESRMQAKMADSQARLQKKQEEVQKNLEVLEAKIREDIDKQLANLPEDIQTKIKEMNSKIESLRDERQKLYDSIRDDVDAQVASIAQEKNQEMVIGAYQYVDPSFQDLTDLSQVRIQQMEKK